MKIESTYYGNIIILMVYPVAEDFEIPVWVGKMPL
jgi:hypothetical protein